MATVSIRQVLVSSENSEPKEMSSNSITCPFCLVAFHDDGKTNKLGDDLGHSVYSKIQSCPSCKRLIVEISKCSWNGQSWILISTNLVYPKSSARKPPSPEVPISYRNDYLEACLVVNDSPQASAALTRRLLQSLLHDQAKIKEKNLDQEIQRFIDSPTTPSHLAEAVDAIRVNGNFAAHPVKSQSTGEICKVEPHEAEWNLDVVDELFDFFFVSPARLKSKRMQLNQKLAKTGKPQLK